MRLKLNGCELECAGGTSYLELLESLPAECRPDLPLGVSVQGRTLALTEQAEGGADARLITFRDEEGRRIYERSLQFVFLAALKREAPQARARIEHSFGQGVYIDLSGITASPALARRLEARKIGRAHV